MASDYLNKYIKFVEEKKHIQLREKQRMAMYSVDSNKDVLCMLPTAYGKTQVGHFAVSRAVENGKLVFWLTALKVLAEQTVNDLSSISQVLQISSDYDQAKLKILKGVYKIVVCTYETYFQILSSSKFRQKMTNIGLVVVDEAHTIGNVNRGMRLETAIIMTKYFFPSAQYLYLSATIGNARQLTKFLNAELIYASQKERPVPLVKKIVIYPEQYDYSSNNIQKSALLDEIISSKIINSSDQMLVFCSSRKDAESISIHIRNKFGISAAYHHAGLNKQERAETELKFHMGKTKIIACTPTLAVGVNLPASYVVLFDVTRYSYVRSENEFIGIDEVTQILGRAGRPGFSKYGYAYAFVSSKEVAAFEGKIWDAEFNVSSQIATKLDTFILYLIACGIRSKNDIIRMYNKSCIVEKDLTELENVFKYLLTDKFIVINDPALELYSITFKGNITIMFAIETKTTQYLFMLLRSQKNYINMNDSIKYMLLNIAGNQEFMSLIHTSKKDSETIDFVEGTMFRTEMDQLKSRRKINYVDPRISKAMPYILINDLENYPPESVPIVSQSDSRTLRDQLARMCAASIVIAEDKMIKAKLTSLLESIKSGTLDQTICNLMQIDQIGKERAKKLKKNGIKSITEFLDTDVSTLATILGFRSTEQVSDMKESARIVLADAELVK